jgi:hypothetical protein
MEPERRDLLYIVFESTFSNFLVIECDENTLKICILGFGVVKHTIKIPAAIAMITNKTNPNIA